MKITQRIRRAAGWTDDEIGGIGSRGVDILVVKRPPPVDCSEAVKKARLGEERLIVSARPIRSRPTARLQRKAGRRHGRSRPRIYGAV
jgi:hypothetical protein